MPAFVSPYTYVPDPTGDRSMFNGDMFFGDPNTDPTDPANQITVRRVEEDGSFTNLSQPVQIGAGGVVTVDGAPAQLDIVENNYSVLIRDRNDVQRFSFPSAGPGGASGREVLLSQGGLPFDATLITTAPTLVINPLIHYNALILANTETNPITINLPSAALTGDKFRVTIKKSTPDANTITIDPDGADRIDFQTTLTITEQFETLTISTDGANWWTHSVFLRNAGSRLRAVETRSTTNQTNVSNNASRLAVLEGLPRVYAMARTNAAGTIVFGNGLSVVNPGAGRYDYTFTTTIPAAVLNRVNVHVEAHSNRITSVSSFSATGFRANFNLIQQPDGDAGSNIEHFVTVIADPSVFDALP